MQNYLPEHVMLCGRCKSSSFYDYRCVRFCRVSLHVFVEVGPRVVVVCIYVFVFLVSINAHDDVFTVARVFDVQDI